MRLGSAHSQCCSEADVAKRLADASCDDDGDERLQQKAPHATCDEHSTYEHLLGRSRRTSSSDGALLC